MRSYDRAPEFLRKLMEENSVTVSSLAESSGIDAGILRQILSGRRKTISIRNIMALSRFFGLPMQEMMDKMA